MQESAFSDDIYLALGEGLTAWDGETIHPRRSDVRLARETTRMIIRPEQMRYLDEQHQTSDLPTTCVEVTALLSGDDIGAMTLREFGLFGGDATSAADSGLMIDYVIHPRIDLAPGLDISRTIRLYFTFNSSAQHEAVETLADLPVISIDGVGEEIAVQLEGYGIRTLADIIGIDPLVPLPGIKPVSLREFRAKARMAVYLRITSLVLFEALGERTISSILLTRPEEIASETNRPEVTAEIAALFQQELAALQIGLDERVLKKFTIRQLLEG